MKLRRLTTAEKLEAVRLYTEEAATPWTIQAKMPHLSVRQIRTALSGVMPPRRRVDPSEDEVVQEAAKIRSEWPEYRWRESWVGKPFLDREEYLRAIKLLAG